MKLNEGGGGGGLCAKSVFCPRERVNTEYVCFPRAQPARAFQPPPAEPVAPLIEARLCIYVYKCVTRLPTRVPAG